MTQRTFWRISSTDGTSAPPDPAVLADALRLHLQHGGAFTTVTMQIGERQRAYIALDGCGPCSATPPRPCLASCRVDLLRRMLRAYWPSLALHAAPSGLIDRAYTRFVPLLPTATAQPWTQAQIAAWPDARLLVWWTHSAAGLQCGAVLAVGADGPDPVTVAEAHGWTRARRPGMLVQHHARATFPPATWATRPYAGDPAIMLPPGMPAPAPVTTMPTASAAPAQAADGAPSEKPDGWGDDADAADGGIAHADRSGPDRGPDDAAPPVLLAPIAPTLPAVPTVASRLAAHLAPLIIPDAAADDAFAMHWSETATPTAPVRRDRTMLLDGAYDRQCVETIDDPDGSIWPRGPGSMHASDMGDLIAALRTAPLIVGDAEPGVTRKRLAGVLADSHTEYARQILVWLDAAGVLAPAPMPEEPFRVPRPLQPLDDGTLAERLAATPIPSSADARAATQ